MLLRLCAALSLALLALLLGGALYLLQQRAALPAYADAAAAPPTPTRIRFPERPTPTPPASALSWFMATATATPAPSPTTAPSATPAPTPSATPEPVPTAPPVESAASFEPGGGAFLHNIRVALEANGGALQRVTLAPGATFSFVGALGPRPTRLSWRNVFLLTPESDVGDVFFSTLALSETLPLPPALEPVAPPEGAEQSAPTPAPLPLTPTATPEPVLGGGVCDLASRYVVAARPLLPTAAFSYRRHSGGVKGVRAQDAVSIWFERGGTVNDLRITNLTGRWLIFETTLDKKGVVTVTARLQDAP